MNKVQAMQVRGAELKDAIIEFVRSRSDDFLMFGPFEDEVEARIMAFVVLHHMCELDSELVECHCGRAEFVREGDAMNGWYLHVRNITPPLQ